MGKSDITPRIKKLIGTAIYPYKDNPCISIPSMRTETLNFEPLNLEKCKLCSLEHAIFLPTMQYAIRHICDFILSFLYLILLMMHSIFLFLFSANREDGHCLNKLPQRQALWSRLHCAINYKTN